MNVSGRIDDSGRSRAGGDCLIRRLASSPRGGRSPSDAETVSVFEQLWVSDVGWGTPSEVRRHEPLAGVSACCDRDPQPPRAVTHSVHLDVGQPDEEFAHTRRISLQLGLPGRSASSTNRLAGPLCRTSDHLRDQPEATLKSEAPIMRGVTEHRGMHVRAANSLSDSAAATTTSVMS